MASQNPTYLCGECGHNETDHVEDESTGNNPCSVKDCDCGDYVEEDEE